MGISRYRSSENPDDVFQLANEEIRQGVRPSEIYGLEHGKVHHGILWKCFLDAHEVCVL